MDREELKKNFVLSLKPLLEDKIAQDDEEIFDFYMEVCCVIAEEYLHRNSDKKTDEDEG
jgi:hypothetical protein